MEHSGNKLIREIDKNINKIIIPGTGAGSSKTYSFLNAPECAPSMIED